ncbi:MAG TPA: outer membrane protein transport protein [Casimicrobiaceae bacterium]|nr:outer membrane protein transport protein [Casimicrobiaceae bacterium]
MSFPFRRTHVASALVAAAATVAAPLAQGAAFALQENNASGLGNAYAGGAAIAEDASTVWWNPAGMARLKHREAVQAIHLISPSTKFSDDGSIAALGQPLGNNGGNAGDLAFIPNLFVVIPYSRQLAFGLGVNVPFGLTTEYDDGWIGRYHAIKSQVKTINVQPTVSWRVNDQFSVGLGISFQWIDAKLTSDVNYSAAIAQGAQAAATAGQIPAAAVPGILAATRGLDARSTVKGDDTAFGFNVGALWEINPDTRLGVHYRSRLKYDVRGDVDFNYPAISSVPPALAPAVTAITNGVNRALFAGDVRSDIELPPMFNISFFRRIDDRWDIMADAQWTGWSTLKELTFVRAEGPVLQTTPQNFDDVWRLSVGANYRLNDRWMLRGGLAYDESPVNDVDRTPRLPDADRTWFSFGAQWKYSPTMTFDAGFTYIIVDDPSISTDAGSIPRNGLLRGNYSAHVTIVSAQVAMKF